MGSEIKINMADATSCPDRQVNVEVLPGMTISINRGSSQVWDRSHGHKTPMAETGIYAGIPVAIPSNRWDPYMGSPPSALWECASDIQRIADCQDAIYLTATTLSEAKEELVGILRAQNPCGPGISRVFPDSASHNGVIVTLPWVYNPEEAVSEEANGLPIRDECDIMGLLPPGITHRDIKSRKYIPMIGNRVSQFVQQRYNYDAALRIPPDLQALRDRGYTATSARILRFWPEDRWNKYCDGIRESVMVSRPDPYTLINLVQIICLKTNRAIVGVYGNLHLRTISTATNMHGTPQAARSRSDSIACLGQLVDIIKKLHLKVDWASKDGCQFREQHRPFLTKGVGDKKVDKFLKSLIQYIPGTSQ